MPLRAMRSRSRDRDRDRGRERDSRQRRSPERAVRDSRAAGSGWDRDWERLRDRDRDGRTDGRGGSSRRSRSRDRGEREHGKSDRGRSDRDREKERDREKDRADRDKGRSDRGKEGKSDKDKEKNRDRRSPERSRGRQQDADGGSNRADKAGPVGREDNAATAQDAGEAAAGDKQRPGSCKRSRSRSFSPSAAPDRQADAVAAQPAQNGDDAAAAEGDVPLRHSKRARSSSRGRSSEQLDAQAGDTAAAGEGQQQPHTPDGKPSCVRVVRHKAVAGGVYCTGSVDSTSQLLPRWQYRDAPHKYAIWSSTGLCVSAGLAPHRGGCAAGLFMRTNSCRWRRPWRVLMVCWLWPNLCCGVMGTRD